MSSALAIVVPLLVLAVIVGTYVSVVRARPVIIERDGVSDGAALQRIEEMLRKRLGQSRVRCEIRGKGASVVVADLTTQLPTGQEPLYRMYSRAIEIEVSDGRLLVRGIPNPFRVSMSARDRQYSAEVLRELMRVAGLPV